MERACTILKERLTGKGLLRRPILRWEDNIRTDVLVIVVIIDSA